MKYGCGAMVGVPHGLVLGGSNGAPRGALNRTLIHVISTAARSTSARGLAGRVRLSASAPQILPHGLV